jgi:hypothetical protein
MILETEGTERWQLEIEKKEKCSEKLLLTKNIVKSFHSF